MRVASNHPSLSHHLPRLHAVHPVAALWSSRNPHMHGRRVERAGLFPPFFYFCLFSSRAFFLQSSFQISHSFTFIPHIQNHTLLHVAAAPNAAAEARAVLGGVQECFSGVFLRCL